MGSNRDAQESYDLLVVSRDLNQGMLLSSKNPLNPEPSSQNYGTSIEASIYHNPHYGNPKPLINPFTLY